MNLCIKEMLCTFDSADCFIINRKHIIRDNVEIIEGKKSHSGKCLENAKIN